MKRQREKEESGRDSDPGVVKSEAKSKEASLHLGWTELNGTGLHRPGRPPHFIPISRCQDYISSSSSIAL